MSNQFVLSAARRFIRQREGDIDACVEAIDKFIDDQAARGVSREDASMAYGEAFNNNDAISAQFWREYEGDPRVVEGVK